MARLDLVGRGLAGHGRQGWLGHALARQELGGAGMASYGATRYDLAGWGWLVEARHGESR